MNDHNYITWELLALGLLSVLQIIVFGLAAWTLNTLLKVARKGERTASRVAHIESHLETNPIEGQKFQRL